MAALKSWRKGENSKGEPGFWLEFDYDPVIITQLKLAIPSYLREWDADKKQWWVHEDCEVPVNRIFPGFINAIAEQRLKARESVKEHESLFDELWE
jgi:hypothetical protein